MPIAAIPKYLAKQDLSTASPGLRFGMYLSLWGVDNRTEALLWTTHDVNYRIAGREHQERSFRDDNKRTALNKAIILTAKDRHMMAELLTRQSAVAEALADPGGLLTYDAISIAPFSTGLGNEHPLENGFSFLNPYGLPYLPGSGVKGVLRQAARELASGQWGDSHGWTTEVIAAFFGKEDSNNAQRGSLSFWDVIPQIITGALEVEVMTAHQSHYYQNKDSPHESGTPVPINFLTVPPKAEFTFHVQCDVPFLTKLLPELVEDVVWKRLLQAAFEHAFDWLGFGAKTAVGYGAMEPDHRKIEQSRKKAAEEKEKLKRIAEEKARRQAEVEELARKKAVFDALPESDRNLHELSRDLEDFAGIEAPLGKDVYGNLVGLVNRYVELAENWDTQDEGRSRLADLVEDTYTRLGWYPSGTAKKKRSRQENKKRQMIARIRQGRT